MKSIIVDSNKGHIWKINNEKYSIYTYICESCKMLGRPEFIGYDEDFETEIYSENVLNSDNEINNLTCNELVMKTILK